MFSCPGSSCYRASPEDGDSVFLQNVDYLPKSPHSVTTRRINIDTLSFSITSNLISKWNIFSESKRWI
jgi:hypothetical protein